MRITFGVGRRRWATPVLVFMIVAVAMGLGSCTDGPTQPQSRKAGEGSGRTTDEPYCGFGSYSDCPLAPISGGGGDYGCTSPATGIDYCQGGGTGGGIAGDGGGSGGAAPSGGGSGGASGTPTVAPDTARRSRCYSGDPIVDNLFIQDALRKLWVESNPTASSMYERKEQGGWIVSAGGPGDYLFVPFTDVTYGACAITPANGAFALPPGSHVVAWIHTHPYAFGEWMEPCKERDNNGTGVYVVPTYRGLPSPDDARTGNNINARLAAQNRPAIDGYMIDNEGIHRFRPVVGSTAINYRQIDRCGY